MKALIRHPAVHSLLAVFASMLLLVSRKPDSFLNAQFWAEDGRNWYADAYNNGFFHALLTPEAGYFQTFSRIVASLAQALPLSDGPLFFNLVAALLQVAVASFIVSDRMKTLLPERWTRYLLAFLYLSMPHAWEVFVNVTNSQWHLALLVCLILLSAPPVTGLGKAADILAACISAVSGPFCLLLFPVAWTRAAITRSRHVLTIAVVITAGCLVQAYSLLTKVRDVQSELGASIELLIAMIGRHLVIGPLLGIRGFAVIEKAGLWGTGTAAILTLAALILAGYAAWRASNELRLLMLFTLLICIGAFGWPAVTLEPGQWRVIAENPTALRYWFIPTFCLYVILLYFTGDKTNPLRRKASVAILAICFLGIIADWRIRPFRDLEFQTYAAEFERVPSGTVYVIPINPDWKMELRKK